MYFVGLDDQDRVVLRLEDGSGMTMTLAMTAEEASRLVRLLETNVQTLLKEKS